MASTTYRITWADGSTSTVAVESDERARITVRIHGSREPLLPLLDYSIASAVEAELVYIAQKHGAKLG